MTYKRNPRDDLSQPEVIPIGVPIPDLQLYLLNEAGELVPDGMPEGFTLLVQVWRGDISTARNSLRNVSSNLSQQTERVCITPVIALFVWLMVSLHI